MPWVDEPPRPPDSAWAMLGSDDDAPIDHGGPDDPHNEPDGERTARFPTAAMRYQQARGYRSQPGQRLSDFTQFDQATLPHRVPAPPDVPVVEEDEEDAPDLAAADLDAIAN